MLSCLVYKFKFVCYLFHYVIKDQVSPSLLHIYSISYHMPSHVTTLKVPLICIHV
ncbi:hypothetical protein Hanom_Chr07g00615031 [Helianthus anomalus]